MPSPSCVCLQGCGGTWALCKALHGYLPACIPCIFGTTKFWAHFIKYLCTILRVENSLKMHHSPLCYCVMSLLFLNSSSCHFSGQSGTVCTHELPSMVTKLLYDIGWTSIQSFHGSLLCIIESPLWQLIISVFYPTPVLKYNLYKLIWCELEN